MSHTDEGKRHEQKRVDEAPPYPVEIGVDKETGLPGYAPAGVKTWQPQKQPTGQARTPAQHEPNRLIASIRMVIAPSMAGRKRWRMVKDLFRNTQEQYDDLVREIAYALHNFRGAYRQA